MMERYNLMMVCYCDPPVVIVGVSVAIHGVGVGVSCLGEALLILTRAGARGPRLV